MISESGMSCGCNKLRSKFMVLISAGPSVYVEYNDFVVFPAHMCCRIVLPQR